MKKLRADLHIHTVLSPCADLEMTPANIVKRAKETGLDIIGITDHNSTKHAKQVKKLAGEKGIFVLTGAEVTTKEEVHCLAFFETENQLEDFQLYLEKYRSSIPNLNGVYGFQPVIDESENILEMIPYFLPAALKVGITEIQQKVYRLNGIFIPAHVDRPVTGLFSQLGFIPPGLKFDALGISRYSSVNDVRKHYVIKNNISLIRNSDAHILRQIGENYSIFTIERADFSEIKKALNQQDNRFVEIYENHFRPYS